MHRNASSSSTLLHWKQTQMFHQMKSAAARCITSTCNWSVDYKNDIHRKIRTITNNEMFSSIQQLYTCIDLSCQHWLRWLMMLVTNVKWPSLTNRGTHEHTDGLNPSLVLHFLDILQSHNYSHYTRSKINSPLATIISNFLSSMDSKDRLWYMRIIAL